MSRTPISDLIAVMLSTGHPISEILLSTGHLESALVDQLNVALAEVATLKGLRKTSRDRKARWRKKVKNKNLPPSLLTLELDSIEARKKERGPAVKKIEGGDLFGNLSAPADDWPDDYARQFWSAWPSHKRKYDFEGVARRLARVRKDGIKGQGMVTWATLMDGLSAYLKTRPDPTYIPAPLVWLNGARWAADYSNVLGGKKLTFGDIMRGGSIDEREQGNGFGAGRNASGSGR